MKNIIILFFIFNGLFCYSQTTTTNLLFQFEGRVAPYFIPEGTFNPRIKTFHSIGRNLSGGAFNWGVNTLFEKYHLGLQFSQSFRYDHVHFAPTYPDPNIRKYGTLESVNKFLNDVHLTLLGFVDIKRTRITLMLGHSWMNSNSTFAEVENWAEPGDTPQYFVIEENFSYKSIHTGIQFNRNRLGAYLKLYYTNRNNHRFNPDTYLLQPTIGITYSLPLKLINKEN